MHQPPPQQQMTIQCSACGSQLRCPAPGTPMVQCGVCTNIIGLAPQQQHQYPQGQYQQQQQHQVIQQQNYYPGQQQQQYQPGGPTAMVPPAASSAAGSGISMGSGSSTRVHGGPQQQGQAAGIPSMTLWVVDDSKSEAKCFRMLVRSMGMMHEWHISYLNWELQSLGSGRGS